MASISANGSKGHHKFTLNVTQSATNIANNTSTLSFDFKISPIYTSWNFYEWNTLIAYTITINGTSYTGYIPDYDGYSIVTLKTGTQAVTHNADGTKSISYSFSVTDATGQTYTPGNASASGTFTLSTIPRASTISAVSGNTIGGTATVTIARAVSSFTHQLWYKVGNSEWYDLGKGIGTSKSFTIDIETAKQFPNTSVGSMQLCVRTYNGTTVIGDDYYYPMIVSVPAYTPTISAIKLTGNNLLSSEYVQGKSTVTVEISASSLYGASIKSYSSTVDGKTYTGNKFTSSVLSNGSKTVSVTVTDTRGRTATLASSTITVRDYAAPTITEFTLVRQATATTVIATVKGSVSSINSKNAKTIQVTLNGVTQTITSSSYSINGTTTFTNVPTDNTLTSVAKITDSYTHATREFVLPTVAVTMDYLADGKGIAMGKVSETTDLLDVAWNERVRKNLTVDGTHTVGGNASVGGTLSVTGATTLKQATTISDNNLAVLTLKRNNDANASTINFQNNNGTLGYIGMTGTTANGGLRRWTADSASSYLFLDTDNTKDYIVEQGTSGVWKYTKWNSGFAECWGYHTISGTNISTAWGGWYASPVITLPSFPFTFSGAPDVHVSWESDFSAIIDGVGKRESTKAGQVYLYRPVAQTNVNGRFSIYAYGKWK